MSDPEYRAKMEEKERLTLEREKKLLQENVQGNQQKSVSREQKMTLNMRNIWKREMQNTTDGIPQEERSRWKP